MSKSLEILIVNNFLYNLVIYRAGGNPPMTKEDMLGEQLKMGDIHPVYEWQGTEGYARI